MKRLFTKVVTSLTPCCRDVVRLSSQSLDRKLTLRERIGIRVHGWICSWCTDYSHQVHHLGNAMRNEGESLAELKGGALSEDCKARLLKLMEESKIKDRTFD